MEPIMLMLTVLRTSQVSVSPPTFTTSALRAGLTGIAYYAEIEATNATSFAVTVGSLPTGYTLTTISDGLAAISGTCDTGGETPFTITATGAGGSTALETSIEVAWTWDGAHEALKTEGVLPLWWEFTEASGVVINYGSAGSALNGTVSGATLPLTRGIDTLLGISQGYEFPGAGSNALVQASNAGGQLNATTFSIVALIKPDSAGGSSSGRIVAHRFANLMGFDSGFIAFNVPAATTAARSLFAVPFTYGQWTLLIATYDDAGDRKLHAYYPTAGVMAERVTYSQHIAAVGALTNPNGVFQVGGVGNTSLGYDGTNDNVSFVSRVLTLTEMQRFYDAAFGAATPETYSVSSLLIDPAFSYAGLNATQQGYYDDMWTAISSASEYPGGDNLVTYSGGYDYATDPENSYIYQVGYGWRYVLWAYAAAFHKTGEQALFDEIERLSDILADNVGSVETAGALYESMYECTVALTMLLYYANKSTPAYNTKFLFWRDHLLARIATQGGGAIVQSSLAHSATSAMFTAFALHLVTANPVYLAQARQLRQTWQSEVSALSPTGRVVWYHRFPRSAAAGDQYAQPTNYADYTVAAITFLYELGFRWHNDLAGYDMPRLAGTLLHMTATGDSCTGDVDGGDGFITPTLYSIRTLAMLSKYDVSGVIATRSLAIKALANSPANLSAAPACLLFGS